MNYCIVEYTNTGGEAKARVTRVLNGIEEC